MIFVHNTDELHTSVVKMNNSEELFKDSIEGLNIN